MSAKEFNRIDVAKWLNTLGYDFEVDSKDDLWMKEFITDHKLSDIFDICLAWGEKVANESKNCNLQSVSVSLLNLIQLQADIYTEREAKAYESAAHREAYENNIKANTVEQILLMIKSNER